MMAQTYHPLRLLIPANKTKEEVPVWIASDGATYQGQPPQFQVDPVTGFARKIARGVPYRRVYPTPREN